MPSSAAVHVEPFYDAGTGTLTYVVHAGAGTACAIIDPLLDFDAHAGRTSTTSAARVAAYVRAQQLTVAWLLETHAHADHLSAAAFLQRELGGRIGIGKGICAVQRTFGDLYNLGAALATDGSQFDHLFADGETFTIGALPARVLHVPGHTPADLAYVIGESALFVGDTLFMPDVGSARCDFPGGSAVTLYRSIRTLLALPGTLRMFVCHDYPPEGRGPAWETSVGAQRSGNLHVRDGIDESTFVAMREARDATLEMPALMLAAVQVNICAGRLPPPESNGLRYLKLPLDAF